MAAGGETASARGPPVSIASSLRLVSLSAGRGARLPIVAGCRHLAQRSTAIRVETPALILPAPLR
eukprot:3677871-Rhodomonas_salina.1